jgi:DNA topoisomerase-1
VHPVVAQDINDYVRERTGGEFTAKDFRIAASERSRRR